MHKFKKDGFTYKVGDSCKVLSKLSKGYLKVQYTSVDGVLSNSVVHESEITL